MLKVVFIFDSVLILWVISIFKDVLILEVILILGLSSFSSLSLQSNVNKTSHRSYTAGTSKQTDVENHIFSQTQKVG